MKVSPKEANPMASFDNTLSLKVGTAGGTLLSIVPNITSVDVLRTIILAIIGAIVSFFVTLLLKWITKSKEK